MPKNIDDLKRLRMLDADGGGGAGGSGDDDPDKKKDEGGSKDEPKFTQEQVNGIVASEKKKNLAAAYKDLGFEDAESAKAFIEKYKQKEEDEKDDLQKEKEAREKAEKEKASKDNEVALLQNKLTAIQKGCDPNSADDIVTLAMKRVNDDTNFEAALEEVKKQFPSMFEGSSDKGGTGHGGTPPRGRSKDDNKSLGERLAENVKKNSPSKNEFFKN